MCSEKHNSINLGKNGLPELGTDPLISNTAFEAIDVFLCWQKLSGNIIDFDLSTRSDALPDILSLPEILLWLQKTTKDLSALDLRKLSNEDRFIVAKIKGATKYLEIQMGENNSFKDRIQSCLGITPALIPEDLIINNRELLYSQIRDVYSKDPVEFLKTGAWTPTGSSEDVSNLFHQYDKEIVGAFLDWSEIGINPDYYTETVSVDAFWYNWISTDEKGSIRLKVNTFSEHTWYKEQVECLISHELCGHALQALSWKKQIELRNMHPFVGLTTVFTPEQFILEGIAQSLPDFSPFPVLSEKASLRYKSGFLYSLALNNAHYGLQNGQSPEEALETLVTLLPWKKRRENEKKWFEQAQSNSLNGIIQYCYGISRFLFSEIAKTLDGDGGGNFIRDIYTNIYTPEDLLSKYLPNWKSLF